MSATNYLNGARQLVPVAVAVMLVSVTSSHAGGTQPRAPQAQQQSSLERSVQRLTSGLHLTAQQQQRLRTLLVRQHDQMGRVWSDPELSAAERIATTRQISHRTADAIRALLDDKQRKLYNAPSIDKKPTSGRSIDEWMQLAQGSGSSMTTTAGAATRGDAQ